MNTSKPHSIIHPRAQRAQSVLVQYDIDNNCDGSLQSAAVDLIADIMHWCNNAPLNFQGITYVAGLDYQADLAEEQQTFTVFCEEDGSQGTLWIDTVSVPPSTAHSEIALQARKKCANDWGYPVEDVTCIGIAVGDVTIAQWDDNGIPS
jgi:hypothetical protein